MDELELSGFASLNLNEPLLASLAALGYEEPTPIQRAAIPPLLEGRDLLGQAATGTGKTAAFALPLLQRITRDKLTRALVLVPTRELAMQVAEAVQRYGKGMATSVLAIYGGAGMYPQIKALERGVSVVVATPGRALDHLRRGTLKLDNIEVLVLDEADEMLDMGFAEDLELLLKSTPATRQTALFSATLPPRIVAITGKHLREPVRVAIAREPIAAGALPKVRQVAYLVMRAYKPAALGRLLDMESPTSAIVFCRTRTEVDELTERLNGRGYRAEPLHGGLSQEQRDRVMKRFRSGVTTLLIATDVAARGLDIEHVSHVVNYDVPAAPEAYVHRIGRTGRAGRAGIAITLTEPRESRQLRNIESLTRQRIEVASIPSVADLRNRQLERTQGALRELIGGGELDRFRAAVEALGSEFEPLEIAAAAFKLAHQATATPDDEVEIPAVRVPSDKPYPAARPLRPAARPAYPSSPRAPSRSEPRSEARSEPRSEPRPVPRSEPRSAPPTATAFPAQAATEGRVSERPPMPVPKRKPKPPAWEVARIFVGAGSEAGVRPADLVGAITNEAGLDGRAIGAIQIGERYSLVEVPEELVSDVVSALRSTKLKGRKVIVRRDRDNGSNSAGPSYPRNNAPMQH